MTILVIGEALIDRVSDGGVVTDHPGGSPANVALGLARLDAPVTLVTALGPDPEGHAVRDHLEGAGVKVIDASGGAPTSVAHATVGIDGAATYEFDITWNIDAAATDSLPADVEAVHTGSIGAFMRPGAVTVHQIISERRASSTITYDPNVRPSLMEDRAQAVTDIEAMVSLADVVKASDEDLEWLYPGSIAAQVAETWAQRGPAYVVVTMGGAGALLVAADGRTMTVPAPPTVVIDTVGAGDSFMGGLIDGLRHAGALGGDRAALRALTDAQLETIVARCIEIAAITVSRAGANPPTTQELLG